MSSTAIEDSGEDDIKLQKVSQTLIQEIRGNLPSLLWQKTVDQQGNKRVHCWVYANKRKRIVSLLQNFQEWPQLLDPYLQEIATQLVDAFLAYLSYRKDQYATQVPARLQRPGAGPVDPLPNAVCNLLYVLCNIRGVKIISRFLNNEPRYLEQMLTTFVEWETACTSPVYRDETLPPAATAISDANHLVHQMNWEERYIILLWISHLLLAPFPLETLSSESQRPPTGILTDPEGLEATELPSVARTILSICFKYIQSPGKERDAATLLLARLALRVDMQRLGLLASLHAWVFKLLKPQNEQIPPLHACLGALSFVSRLHSAGQTEDLAPYILPTFTVILKLTEGNDGVCLTLRSSALARKTIIKILRSIVVCLLNVPDKLNELVPQLNGDTISMVLENFIDYLLLSLNDTDNPVRFAASKALSLTALNLEPEMASDVIEAVLDSLNENILYEKPDGTLVTPAEAKSAGTQHFKRNVSAVDPLRWQGLILTLAHLLFRRAAPSFLMKQVVRCLIEGLDFEQRSSTGSSVGSGIRDAACFGLWSLSRKYTTHDLLSLNIQDLAISTDPDHHGDAHNLNTLQILATHLVRAACLDSWGNIRRGASAALQEMIGRHPDTVFEGIPLLQIVDYYAVARRERALIDVANDTAKLGRLYWDPLFDGLLQWRGIRAADSPSRRAAARALGRFALLHSFEGVVIVCQFLLGKLLSVSSSDVESRHGLYLSLAALVDAFFECQKTPITSGCDTATQAAHIVSSLWNIFDSEKGPNADSLTLSHLRPDLTAEACSRLISSLSRLYSLSSAQFADSLMPSETSFEKTLQSLLLCVSRDNGIPLEASSEAASNIFLLLSSDKKSRIVQDWISYLQESRQLEVGRAVISALGAVYKHLPLPSHCRKAALDSIIQCTAVEEDIYKRVTAVEGLSTSVLPFTDDIGSLIDNVIAYLNDYTIDRRGDIGSLIRLQALKAVKFILKTKGQDRIRDVMMCVVRLSAEKLDKVRQQAWSCLEIFWSQAMEQQEEESAAPFPPLQVDIEYFSDVSRRGYFSQLLSLIQVPWLRRPLVKGFASSVSFGSEGLIRESRYALIQFLEADVGNKSRRQRCIALLVASTEELECNLHDERYAVPLVEFIAFILDACFDHENTDEHTEPLLKKVFSLVQRSHLRSPNVSRIEAAVHVYASLRRIPATQNLASKKLVSMLYHPFPKARNAAVDSLFLESGAPALRDIDLGLSPMELKPVVDDLSGKLRSNSLT